MVSVTRTDSLRLELRAALKDKHEALDKVVSGFDIGSHEGLRAFIAMQAAALSRLSAAGVGASSAPAIADLLERARTDLVSLGLPAGSDAPTDTAQAAFHPLAIDYVIGGSRLGNAILKKRWLGSRDRRVHAAQAWFTAPSYSDLWQGFCAVAGQMPGTGPDADRITNDAAEIFDMYSRCAASAGEKRVPEHV